MLSIAQLEVRLVSQQEQIRSLTKAGDVAAKTAAIKAAQMTKAQLRDARKIAAEAGVSLPSQNARKRAAKARSNSDWKEQKRRKKSISAARSAEDAARKREAAATLTEVCVS